jgi:two-component system response regulator FixJ
LAHGLRHRGGMVTLSPPPMLWNSMSTSNAPDVFLVAEGEIARQWDSLLRSSRHLPRIVRAATEIPDESPAASCVLLVLNSPSELSGLHACARWLSQADERPLLVLSSAPDVIRLLKVLTVGRLEVIDASAPADEILARINGAIAADSERLRRRAAWREIAERFRNLTVKDRAVLDLLQEGLPNKSIALRLAVTERAVEMRRANLMKKLRARSHAELIRMVTQYEVFANFGLPLPIE